MDELGYIFPISDWRIPCQPILGDTQCNALQEYLEYFDSMSGTTCNLLAEDPGLAPELFGPAADAILAVCSYGQLGEAEDHYEETNSIGWNINVDYFNAISQLIGIPVRGRYYD